MFTSNAEYSEAGFEKVNWNGARYVNTKWGIYLWEEGKGIELVSKTSDGTPFASNHASFDIDLSPDGSKYIFLSDKKLTPNASNRSRQLYLKDIPSGNISLVSGEDIAYAPFLEETEREFFIGHYIIQIKRRMGLCR